jgi:hypothetical protein
MAGTARANAPRAPGGRGARHQRCERPAGPQVQQHGAERGSRRADGYPLQRPGGEQQPWSVRGQERRERHICDLAACRVHITYGHDLLPLLPACAGRVTERRTGAPDEHRDIVRRRWARLSRRGRPGRPAMHRRVRSAVLRLARENEAWGYRRIHGELAGLGITVAASTVWQILKDAGISPAPRRDGPGWAEFLRSQTHGIMALDFFTADLLNGTKIYVLAAIEHGTRRIRILGATENPVQSCVVQLARNLLMDLDDAGMSVKFVLHDRDASFTAAFDAVFQAVGARVVRSAAQAPRMNSIMERWIGSCRRELLDRTLIWNRRRLMTVLREYEDFYNTPPTTSHPEPGRAVPSAARWRH